MNNKNILRLNIIFALIILFFPQTSSSQIRIKAPKLALSMSTGYDSNILKVSRFQDTNIVASQVLELGGKLSSWVYWTRGVKSYLSFSGNYDSYPSNSFANEWSIQMKVNSIAKILSKKSNPVGIKLSIKLFYDNKDTYYTNRLLGEEYTVLIDKVQNLKLPLGDLFDKYDYGIEANIDFDVFSWLSYDLYVVTNKNNYKDLGNMETNSFYSLDNNEFEYGINLNFKIFDSFNLSLEANRTSRKYDHKTTRNIDGKEMVGIKREYLYDVYGIDLVYTTEKIETGLYVGKKDRNDIYEGYYNYSFPQFSIFTKYNFTSSFEVFANYKKSIKSYEVLTLYGNLLENKFDIIKFGISYKFIQNLIISPIYIYKRENSTYDKYAYTRTMLFLKAEYRL